jgi:hypothetical protein
MSEAKLSDEQLRHDLRPLFEGMRAPATLKKVRKRLQAQKQNVRLQRLITMHGLEKLSSLTLRLMQEGSLRPEVCTFLKYLLTSMDADLVIGKFARTGGISQ